MHCKKEELLSSIEDDCFYEVNTPRCIEVVDAYDFMGPFTTDSANIQVALATAIEEFNPKWACLIG